MRQQFDLLLKETRTDVEMNFVMTASHELVEVQATAEYQVFQEQQFAKMLSFVRQGVPRPIGKQQAWLTLKAVDLR
jgi:ribonuclease PH